MYISFKYLKYIVNILAFSIDVSTVTFTLLITLILNIPINIIIKNIANVSNISQLPLNGGVILIIISIILTIIAGLIPSRMASKKEPVIALRTE